MKTVLIIDDHPGYRAGVKAIVKTDDSYKIVGDVGTAREGFGLAEKLRPDIVVVDLELPDMHGVLLIRKIADALKDTKIIVITMHSDPNFVLKAIQAGATGYVLKESETEVILKCLKLVSEGRQYIDSSLNFEEDTKEDDKYQTLTPREQEVMHLMANNLTAKQIAKKLHISQHTVRSHQANIYEKIGVKSKGDLIIYAAKIGLIEIRL